MVEYSAINNVIDYMKLHQGWLFQEGCRSVTLSELFGKKLNVCIKFSLGIIMKNYSDI